MSCSTPINRHACRRRDSNSRANRVCARSILCIGLYPNGGGWGVVRRAEHVVGRVRRCFCLQRKGSRRRNEPSGNVVAVTD